MYAEALKAACAHYGFHADPSVTADVARILRVPGTHNWKIPEEPLDVILDTESLQNGPYPPSCFDHLVEEFGRRKEKQTANSDRATTEYTDFEYAKLFSALKVIKDFDSYDTWLKIGMAIHSLNWGEKGFELWCQWSEQSQKYDPNTQYQKWESFEGDGGVTIAQSLVWPKNKDGHLLRKN